MEQLQMSISDPDSDELYALRDWLWRLPGVEIKLKPSVPTSGELGSADMLVVLADSITVLTVAIRSVPEFIRSRRSPKLIVTVKAGKKSIQIEATNVTDPMPIIQQALDQERDRG